MAPPEAASIDAVAAALGEAEAVAAAVTSAVDPRVRHRPGVLGELVELLAHARPSMVEDQLERQISAMVAVLWSNGWQPAELIREVRRSTNAAGSRLAELAVRADHAGRDAASLAPSWVEQVEALPNHPALDACRWLRQWARAEQFDHPGWIRAALSVLAAIGRCGPIEELVPPPGAEQPVPSVLDLQPIAHPVLERVRALLAQAESTNFEAEAAAFTAKAQELMTRHAIDLAAVAEAGGRGQGAAAAAPQTVRIPVDDPYADMKSLLLSVIADASRCRAVYHPRYAFSTVVGLRHDLMAVEVLFTSLLVQAQTAMAEEATFAPPGARTRSRGFRSTFLHGYATRVATRLVDVNRRVVDDAEQDAGRSLLPVLAAQADLLDREIERRFPDLTTAHRNREVDPFGYLRGTAAADVARLGLGDLPAPR